MEAAVDARIGAIQLREKDLDGGALYDRACQLVSRCASGSTRVLVNDRADVARLASAHGVHLPEAGLPPLVARNVVGNKRLVGRSIHASEEVHESNGVDYLIFGPVYETPSKRCYGAPQGLERLSEVSRASDVPVIAIGGITPARVREVLACGATGVAVMGAILSADDPARMVREFKEALARA